MPNHSRQIILALLAGVLTSGCTTWNPVRLSRPMPESVRAANLEEMVRTPAVSGSRAVSSPTIGTGTREAFSPVAEPVSVARNANVEPIAHDASNYQRAEYQSPDWPDAIYWEDVYRQINAADTRQVTRGGLVTQPLQPLPTAVPTAPLKTDTHQQLLAELKSPAQIVSEPVRDHWTRLDEKSNFVTDLPATVHKDAQVSPALFEFPEKGNQPQPLRVEDHSRAYDLRQPLASASGDSSSTAVPWLTHMSIQMLNCCSQLQHCPTHSAAHHAGVTERLSKFCQKLCELRQLIEIELTDSSLSEPRRQALQIGERMACLLEQSDSADPNVAHHLERQLLTIETLLRQGETVPVAQRGQQAHAVLEHLREAELELVSTASLKIRNPAFCTEVLGFGQYRECDEAVFANEQPVLIYCELENHVSKREVVGLQDRFTTRLRTSLVICDRENQIVQQIEFPTVEDMARGYRRDFYLYVPLTIGTHAPGTYRVFLSVTDLEGNKTTTLDPPLVFEVR